MDDYSLESFISFCDDMLITNEGVASTIGDGIKRIIDSIKRSFRNISTWCKNILRNINYFKEAQIDSQMNDDLTKVLKTSQPRTELNFKPIQLYYKAISITKKSDMKVNRFAVGEVYEHSGYKEQFEDLVDRSNIDTMMAISSTKKSSEYKRLMKNDYKNQKLESIPLNSIIEDVNKTNSMATSFGNQMESIESKSLDLSDNDSIRNKMLSFCKTVVKYCAFRIEILSNYLSVAKASLTSTIKNFTSKGHNTKSNLKYRIPKFSKTVKFDDESFEIFKKHVENMRNANEYKSYKESFDYVSKQFGIKNYVIKQLKIIDSSKKGFVMAVKDDGDTIDTSNSKLWHVSDNPNLTELKPFFRSKSGTTFFPTPRIYVHLNVPLNRLGSTVQLSKEKGDTVVYRVSQRVPKATVDREIGKTAAFIESYQPIKIRKIEYNRWKGQMNFKIKSNIEDN